MEGQPLEPRQHPEPPNDHELFCYIVAGDARLLDPTEGNNFVRRQDGR